MKKTLLIVICLALLMAGCTAKGPEESTGATEPIPSTQAPTEAPVETEPPATEPPVTEPPAPETVPATALADHTVILLTMADRGAQVDIAGEFDEDHYIVKTELGYGLIEKRLVRPEGEPEYEQWSGYAYYNAVFYNNYHLLPEGMQKLNLNTQIQILDKLGTCLVVQWGETVGYMRESDVSRYYTQPAPSGGADGGDITLGYQGGVTKLSTFVPQEGTVSGTGTVLADSAEITLGWFDRNDAVNIISEEGFAEEKAGWYPVYLDGLCGYVRQNLVALEGAEPYAQWKGYAQSKAKVYDNYYLSGEAVSTLSLNAEIQVICDLGNCCLVSIGDAFGYMDKSQISETYIQYSGGGSGGGEWSDPVL